MPPRQRGFDRVGGALRRQVKTTRVCAWQAHCAHDGAVAGMNTPLSGHKKHVPPRPAPPKTAGHLLSDILCLSNVIHEGDRLAVLKLMSFYITDTR